MWDKREVICGMMGDIHWKPVLPASGLDGLEVKGNWSRQGDTVIGDEPKGAGGLTFGEESWTDYEISLQVKPVEGGNVQIMLRATSEGNYLMDFLMGWKAVAVSKADRRPRKKGMHKISVVNFDLEHLHEYDVQIAVRDVSITTYINGQLVNQVTDYDFAKGRVGLSVWHSKTEFRNPRFRLLQ